VLDACLYRDEAEGLGFELVREPEARARIQLGRSARGVQFWVQSEPVSEGSARKSLIGLAPQAGFETATLRLTG
jgi:hypothetical protein